MAERNATIAALKTPRDPVAIALSGHRRRGPSDPASETTLLAVTNDLTATIDKERGDRSFVVQVVE